MAFSFEQGDENRGQIENEVSMKTILLCTLFVIAACGKTKLSIELTGSGTISGTVGKMRDKTSYNTSSISGNLPQTIEEEVEADGQIIVGAFLTSDGNLTATCKKNGEVIDSASASAKLMPVTLTCK